MKKHTSIFTLFLALLTGVFGYSQNNIYTVLDKNTNDNNLGLHQALNRNLDTLILKSDQQILRVRFLSHAQKETISVDVVSKIVRVPLHHFDKGRYTIAVYNGSKIVVLGFNRLLTIDKPEDIELDLEKSILIASLPLEELKSKGLDKLIIKANSVRHNGTNNSTPRVAVASNALQEKSTPALKNDHLENKKLEPLKSTTEDINTFSAENKSASKIQYSITAKKEVGREMETREEFRQRSVRPNGKKYD